jgi:hypothetical protein
VRVDPAGRAHSIKIQQETNARNAKAAELKASALATAKAAAVDAADARRTAPKWDAPAAAINDASAARAEAAELLKSGACDGSSPAAQAAKARFAVLLAKIA